MLQQTRVERVVPYYERFLKKFPTVQKLAKAELSEVLKIWSGLGYNRRAKYLRDAAKTVVEEYDGKFPFIYEDLRKLPGVGDYTARAVRVFAYNEPDVLIETNIRTAFLHNFGLYRSFRGRERRVISDSVILQVASRAAKGQDAREWHWALMDYGANLKKSGVRLNSISKHYVKQSKFEGSLRQVRGEALRRIAKGQKIEKGEQWENALKGLVRDGLVRKVKGKWKIS
jgi:A/G-specific adenine glycosylase